MTWETKASPSIRLPETLAQKMEAVAQSSRDGIEKAILGEVALQEGRRLRCCIESFSTLEKRLGFSERTLRRRLARLKNDGLLRVQSRRTQTSRATVNWQAVVATTSVRESEVNSGQSDRSDRPLRSESPPTPVRVTDKGLYEGKKKRILPPHKRGNGRPSLEGQAMNLLQKELLEAPPDRIQQAARLATLLASSPPNSTAFYRRAVPDILENFPEKVLAWLTKEARRRLGDNGNLRLPDLAEELKSLAAENDIPYSGEVVGTAIDRAWRRLENEHQAQAELRVGAIAR